MKRATIFRAGGGWQNGRRLGLLGLCVSVCLGGCGRAAPGASGRLDQTTVTVTATSAPATVAATATATVTPSVTATATVMPTVTPTATATASATPEPVAVDLSGWQAPLMAGGLTLALVQEMEDTAAELRAGTLESTEAGGRLWAFQITLGMLAQTLEESTLTGAPAGYQQALEDNMAALYRVIDRWQQGEITSATVPGELAGVRAASEATMAGMMGDLRALGVPQDYLDEFMAAVLAGM